MASFSYYFSLHCKGRSEDIESFKKGMCLALDEEEGTEQEEEFYEVFFAADFFTTEYDLEHSPTSMSFSMEEVRGECYTPFVPLMQKFSDISFFFAISEADNSTDNSSTCGYFIFEGDKKTSEEHYSNLDDFEDEVEPLLKDWSGNGAQTSDDWLAFIKKNRSSIEYVPDSIKTADFCLQAIKNNAGFLEYVPELLKTKELCIEAVKNNGLAISDVPERFRTVELCLIACHQNKGATKFVPENLKSQVQEKIKSGNKPSSTDQAPPAFDITEAMDYFKKAENALKNGSKGEALPLLDKTIEYCPPDGLFLKVAEGSSVYRVDVIALALNFRAYCYKELNQLDKAISDLARAIEIEPERAMFYDSRAEMYEAMGEYEKAIADCKKALQIDPEKESSSEIQKRCIKAIRQNKPAAKPATAEKLPDIKKAFYGTWHSPNGTVEIITEDTYELNSPSIDHYKAAIISWDITDNDYDNNWEYPNLVRIKVEVFEIIASDLEEGDKVDIIYFFNLDTKAISCNGSEILEKQESKPAPEATEDQGETNNSELVSAEQWNKTGISFAKEGNFEKAVEAFNKALDLEPENKLSIRNLAFAWFDLGRKSYRNDDLDGAINAFDKSLSINPKDHRIFNSLAYAYLKKKDFNKAIETINKAIALKPDDAIYCDSRAEFYETMGEYEKAIADCKKALELDPEKDSAKEILERCQKALKPTPPPKPAPAAKAPPSPPPVQEATGAVCPKCGKVARVGAKFCSACGTKFDPVCANCGRQLKATSKFCPGCGTKVEQ